MQEMVIPVAVLTAQDELPEGWVEPPSYNRTGGSRRWKTTRGRCGAAGRRGQAPRKKKPGMLFDLEDEAAGQPRWNR